MECEEEIWLNVFINEVETTEILTEPNRRIFSPTDYLPWASHKRLVKLATYSLSNLISLGQWWLNYSLFEANNNFYESLFSLN